MRGVGQRMRRDEGRLRDREACTSNTEHASPLSDVHRIQIAALRPSGSPLHEAGSTGHRLTPAGSRAVLPPIVVRLPTMTVAGGRHRVRTAVPCGPEEIGARFFDGSAEDPFAPPVEAGIGHGLPLVADAYDRSDPEPPLSPPVAGPGHRIGHGPARQDCRCTTPQAQRDDGPPLGQDRPGRQETAAQLRGGPRNRGSAHPRVTPGSLSGGREGGRELRRDRTTRPRPAGPGRSPPRLFRSGEPGHPSHPVRSSPTAVRPRTGILRRPGVGPGTIELFRKVRRDPSSRPTDGGPLLLRMVERQMTNPQRRDRVARSVPPHRA